MKITIDISKEFESNFYKDKFRDCFERAVADIEYRIKSQDIGLCGNYEKEIFEMFIMAFENVTVS